MKPTVTVGLTYFNEKELLTECLESLLAGRDQPDEILVFDDGSKYPAKDYIPQGAPVRVLGTGENRGPSFARNEIIKEAKSEYLHFHDSDDWFHENWLSSVRSELSHGTWDAVFTEVTSYRDGKFVANNVIGLEGLKSDPDLVRFCLNQILLVPSGTYRLSVLRELGGYRMALWQSEDYDFHVRLAAKGIRYFVIPENLIFIRLRAESRSQNFVETRECSVKAVRLLSQEIPQKYFPDLADAAAHFGSQLFQFGAKSQAREAFALAKQLGKPRYARQNRIYRAIAHQLGPEIAERISSLYRKLLPSSLRRALRGRAYPF